MSVTNTMPKNINRTLSRMAEKALLGVQRSLEVIRNEVVATAPVKSGRLVGSFEGQAEASVSLTKDKVYNVTKLKNGASGVIGTNVPYAKIQEFGGVIKPKKKKALSWIGDDGERHFAKSVTIKAKHFLTNAIAASESKILTVITNTLKEKDASPT